MRNPETLMRSREKSLGIADSSSDSVKSNQESPIPHLFSGKIIRNGDSSLALPEDNQEKGIAHEKFRKIIRKSGFLISFRRSQ